jgi:hypothetical protein
MMNSTAQPFKPFVNSEQMNNDKNYNSSSSTAVIKESEDTDEKMRARNLLMRKLAVFRSKTEQSNTSLVRIETLQTTFLHVHWFIGLGCFCFYLQEVNVGQVKPNSHDDGLKSPIENVYSDIKVAKTQPFTTVYGLVLTVCLLFI